jgi:hypothetical protein
VASGAEVDHVTFVDPGSPTSETAPARDVAFALALDAMRSSSTPGIQSLDVVSAATAAGNDEEALLGLLAPLVGGRRAAERAFRVYEASERSIRTCRLPPPVPRATLIFAGRAPDAAWLAAQPGSDVHVFEGADHHSILGGDCANEVAKLIERA